ncbi:MAG: hypothetical protein CM15mP49_27490 [Actinomycetota bacterium]|nr:MAG: hypothetical protein CM15mP49_27490 [Actinomycetota bacterium]
MDVHPYRSESNKTIEGLLGGTLATVGVGVLLAVFDVGPFDGDPFGFSNAFYWE